MAPAFKNILGRFSPGEIKSLIVVHFFVIQDGVQDYNVGNYYSKYEIEIKYKMLFKMASGIIIL